MRPPGHPRTRSDDSRTVGGARGFQRYADPVPRIDADSVVSWAEACSEAFVPLRVRSAAPGFAASLEQRMLSPHVSLTAVTSAASEVYRSDRMIAQHPSDDVILSLHLHGTGSVRQHDRIARLRSGSAAMYDASAPYTLAFSGRMREVVVQLPRRALHLGGAAIGEITARPLPEGPSLRAFTALAVHSLASEATSGTLEDAAVADAMLSLLAAIATAQVASAPAISDPVLATVLRLHVDEFYADPELTPASLAHEHHVSLRLVQKVFAETGDSPAAYIRSRRLRAARALLLAGEPVVRAAWNSGFRDPDTFRRAFRREYGTAPSSLARTAR